MIVDDDYNALVETLDTINGKLAAMKTARFFTERQQRADTDAFKRILTRQGGQEPCEGDALGLVDCSVTKDHIELFLI